MGHGGAGIAHNVVVVVSLKNAAWLETLVDLLSAMQFLASAMRHIAKQLSCAMRHSAKQLSSAMSHSAKQFC
jgi:hypothetical protein